MALYHTSRTQTRGTESDTYHRQRDLIVECARKCMEEKGVQKTTLVDIAREANITRELIYYYFAGKREIVDQLLESYILDAVETAQLWCDAWDDPSVDENTPLPREAIADAIAAVRRFVFSAEGSRRSMFAVLNEVGARQEVFARICRAIVSELGSTHTAKRLGATFSQFDDTLSERSFMFCLLGVIGLIECNNATDEELVDVLCANMA